MSVTEQEAAPAVAGRPERTLAYRVIGIRDRVRAGGAGRGVLSAVAAGIHPMTEAGAFPYTEAALSGLSVSQRVGARRAAAMIAVHRDARATSEGHTPIGSTLRSLHAKAHSSWPGDVDGKSVPKRTAMSMSVDSLPLLDVDNAAQVISGLVGRCAQHGIPVDFASLATTLTFWGDGLSSKSRSHRAKVVQDFYGLSDRRDHATSATTPAAAAQ
ncbi:type I-E CRISPR-associated protein Cse2/CasB [Nocardioides campestrisoli]|uniref:type I-E CRISPR-associated protein Cse2/CasB n=1 Tax=Nocardioides campestrisoli TaxID=2736757 RepID=UPI00163D8698|nr:type I-E CRISPR-associated protein Cse2/CasB [Nocardioides campestrisoli]